MGSKIALFLSIFLIAALVAGGIAFSYFLANLTPPQPASTDIKTFNVEEGMGVKEIAAALFREGLIKDTFVFETYVWLESAGAKLQAGRYSLSPRMSASEIVRIVSQGEALADEQSITILEGWRTDEIATYLENQGLVTSAAFIDAAGTTDSRQLIPDVSYDFLVDKSNTAGLEGYLFPDTYRIFRNAESADIIEKMLDNFGRKVDADVRTTIAASGRTIFDTVTMASIIEEELTTDRDRKLAADLFWRRIGLGMPLESDATVNYVTGKSELQPSSTDVATEHPYNTYRNLGLPPGPIGNPSLGSIVAAADPEPNEFLYFLTKPNGEAVFSKTYEEHLQNKAAFLD